MKDAPFYALLQSSEKALAKGRDILHLNIGQPDLPTPPEALQILKEQTSEIIPYGPSIGMLSLREKVAEYYSSFQVSIAASDVVVTTGASEAIMFALLSCLDVDDEVIIPEPFYANYNGFAATCATKLVAIQSHIDQEFNLPEVRDFEALLSPRTKAIMLCNPGNPTGQLYSEDALSKILDFAILNDLFLIVDEVYREFCYDDAFTSILSFDKGEENVLVVDSVSKVFSLCGARIGFLVTKNKKLQMSAHKYAQLRLCPPHLGQLMAEACYNHRQQYIPESRAIFKERRDLLYQGLQHIPEIKYYKPRAAFYNIIELPIENALHFCQWILSEFNIDNQTIMLAPAEGFYADRERGMSQIRLAYMLDKSKLANAIEILSKGLAAYKGKFPVH